MRSLPRKKAVTHRKKPAQGGKVRRSLEWCFPRCFHHQNFTTWCRYTPHTPGKSLEVCAFLDGEWRDGEDEHVNILTVPKGIQYQTTHQPRSVETNNKPAKHLLQQQRKQKARKAKQETMTDDQLDMAFSKLWGGFTYGVPDELCQVAMQAVDLNRYSNILPFDSHLASEPHEYCNASLVGIPECKQRYLIAQGPMHPAFHGPNTVPAFWQVMRNHNVRVVVSLTAFSPGFSGCADPVACDPNVRVVEKFTPSSAAAAASSTPSTSPKVASRSRSLVGKLAGTLRRRKESSPAAAPDADEDTVISVLDLGDEYLLHYIHFRAWPNYGTCSPSQLASLVDVVDGLQAAHQPPVDSSTSTFPPIGVHCSGGIGRSGTFVAAHASSQRLRPLLLARADEGSSMDGKLPFDTVVGTLNDTINALRHARHPWMVEGEEQYKLSYHALQLLLAKA
jgi:protein tyrosine phosphatase